MGSGRWELLSAVEETRKDVSSTEDIEIRVTGLVLQSGSDKSGFAIQIGDKKEQREKEKMKGAEEKRRADRKKGAEGKRIAVETREPRKIGKLRKRG